jgi:hypothetical protein
MTNCASHFSDFYASVMRALTLTSASLSMFGAGFMILSYLTFPRLRTFPFKLIVFLSVSDAFASSAYLIGMIGVTTGQVCNTAFACYLSAQMSQFFDVATFLWTGVIAFNVYQVMVREKGRSVEQYERRYHWFVWGTSLTLMLIAGGTGAFGDAGLWCWIMNTYPKTQFLCYYLILILVFFCNITVLVLVGLALRNDASSNTNTVTIRLLSYLFVFFIVRIWSVIDRLTELITGNPSLALAILHSIFSPLQGFCNALVYGMNRQVINEWKYSKFCQRLLCKYGRQAEFASHELLRDENQLDDAGHELAVFQDYADPSESGTGAFGGSYTGDEADNTTGTSREVVVLIDDDSRDIDKW